MRVGFCWSKLVLVLTLQAACEDNRTAAERIFILQLLTGQLDSQVLTPAPGSCRRMCII